MVAAVLILDTQARSESAGLSRSIKSALFTDAVKSSRPRSK
jgi:hypothetical protein